MVRGGKAQIKRNSKRRVNSNEDSDESDEDYVASDAQSDASEDVLVDLAEDSLDDEVDEQVIDDNDDDFKVIDEEEEEEEDDNDSVFVKSGRTVSKTVRKPHVVSLRKEDDEDYEANLDDEDADEDEDDFNVMEDEEEEEEDDNDSVSVKSGRSVSKTMPKPHVVSLRKEDDEDYEANLDDEDADEDEDDFKVIEEEEDDNDSDFVKPGRSVSKTVRKPHVVNLRKEDDEDYEANLNDEDEDEEDFKVIEEEEDDNDSDFVESGRSVSKTVPKPHVVSLRKEDDEGYEANLDDEDADEDEDEDDFKVIEEEEDDNDLDFVKSGRSVSKTVPKPHVVSLRKEDDEDYEANLDDEDADEEFTSEEDVSLEEEEDICISRWKIDPQPKVKEWGSRKRRKLTAPKKPSRNRRGRIGRALKKPKLSDIFEDEDDVGVSKPVKTVKKKKTISRRKSRYSSKSGFGLVSSESSDVEFTISEEEREQIREASKLCADLAAPQRSLVLPEKPKQERPSRSRVATSSQCTAGLPMNIIAIKGKQKVEEEDPKQVCGICFSEEEKRRIRGKLDCCTHYFCFTCIMEWAKVETRCPLCKQRFKTINKPSRVDLRDVVIQVPERDQVYQPTEEEIRGYLDPYENVICTECHLGGDDGLMLLCDLCDSPAHTFCVGLGREVPEGNWYCEGCQPAALESGHAQDMLPDPAGRAQTGSNPVDGLDLNVVPTPAPSFNQRVVGNLTFPRFPGEINPFGTLTGRRMLQSHIQRLRSGSRLNPLVRATERAPPVTRVDSFISLFGERLLQQNGSVPVSNCDGFGDGSGLAPNTMPGGFGFGFGAGPTHEPLCIQSSSNGARQDYNFYNAMEQMQSVVQNHLSRLSVDLRLGQDQMKDIVRNATQSILAACGRGRAEPDRAPPPLVCPHTDRRMSGDTSPMRDLCSGCFHEFTRNVVQSVVNAKLPHNQNEWLSLGL